MRIVFGCPVVDRAWILREWFEAIDAQEGIDDYAIACVASPSVDDTMAMIRAHPKARLWEMRSPRRSIENVVRHSWPEEDVRVVAEARMLLRSRVLAAYEFDYFFSLDSDVIIEPSCTKQLLRWLEYGPDNCSVADAVSPLVKMTPEHCTDYVAWNFMEFVEGSVMATRPKTQAPPDSAQPVDVLMAAILMRREVLEESQWDPHPQGEDISWSRLARHHGHRLLIDPSVKGDHRMYAPHLT